MFPLRFIAILDLTVIVRELENQAEAIDSHSSLGSNIKHATWMGGRAESRTRRVVTWSNYSTEQ